MYVSAGLILISETSTCALSCIPAIAPCTKPDLIASFLVKVQETPDDHVSNHRCRKILGPTCPATVVFKSNPGKPGLFRVWSLSSHPIRSRSQWTFICPLGAQQDAHAKLVFNTFARRKYLCNHFVVTFYSYPCRELYSSRLSSMLLTRWIA